MEYPNHTASVPSLTSILKKISDDKALVLFNSIALSNYDGYLPLKDMNMSTKQYYSRISGLLNTGLIKKHKGKYSLTFLGKVVYESQIAVGKALSYYWKLRAIESIEMSSSGLPTEEMTQLINVLIDNHQIKDVLMKPISVNSNESSSKMQTSNVLA
jgi:predicted transcriptional regulator